MTTKTIALTVPSIDKRGAKKSSVSSVSGLGMHVQVKKRSERIKSSSGLGEESLNLSMHSANTQTLMPWNERQPSPKSKRRPVDKAQMQLNTSSILSVASSISQSSLSPPSSPATIKLQPLRVNVEKNFLTVSPKPISIKRMDSSSVSEHAKEDASLDDGSVADGIGINVDISNKSPTQDGMGGDERGILRTNVIDLSASIFIDDVKDIDRRGFRGNAFSVTRPIADFGQSAQSNFQPNESTSTLHTNPMLMESAEKDIQSAHESIGDSRITGSAESRMSDKDRVSLTTAESGIQRLTLHSRTLSQYTKSLNSLNDNIVPPYIITDTGPPPEVNWYESQAAKYIIQNRLVGWKLTQRPRRRDIVNLFELVEGVDHGTYAGSAELSKLKRVTKNTLRGKLASGTDLPPSLEDFVNSMESESTETLSLRRREADAWRSTVTRLIRARDSTPAGIAARHKNEKEEKERNRSRNIDDNTRQSTVKLLCASDRLSILENARKQELMSREKERERETISRGRTATPGLLRDRLLTPSFLRGNAALDGVESDERKENDDGVELYIRELYSRGASRGASRSTLVPQEEGYEDEIS